MLEYFAHLDQDDPPADLVLAVAEAPDDLIVEQVEIGSLPADWREYPAPAQLRIVVRDVEPLRYDSRMFRKQRRHKRRIFLKSRCGYN